MITMASTILCSCTFENDLFEAYKEAPYFIFTYKGQNFEGISDSLKIPSAGLGKTPINFELKINDKSNLLQISYEPLQGVGELLINGDIIERDQINKIARGNHSAQYVPQRNGKHHLILNLIDLYGNTISKEAQFVVFSNLPPVASCEVRNVGQYSKFEIEIDASKSRDLDEKWGGRVEEYIYKIGSYYEFRTNEFSSIKHIFPGAGTYVISIQVKDNDGAVSEPVFHEIRF